MEKTVNQIPVFFIFCLMECRFFKKDQLEKGACFHDIFRLQLKDMNRILVKPPPVYCNVN